MIFSAGASRLRKELRRLYFVFVFFLEGFVYTVLSHAGVVYNNPRPEVSPGHVVS